MWEHTESSTVDRVREDEPQALQQSGRLGDLDALPHCSRQHLDLETGSAPDLGSDTHADCTDLEVDLLWGGMRINLRHGGSCSLEVVSLNHDTSYEMVLSFSRPGDFSEETETYATRGGRTGRRTADRRAPRQGRPSTSTHRASSQTRNQWRTR